MNYLQNARLTKFESCVIGHSMSLEMTHSIDHINVTINVQCHFQIPEWG